MDRSYEACIKIPMMDGRLHLWHFFLVKPLDFHCVLNHWQGVSDGAFALWQLLSSKPLDSMGVE